MNVNAMIKRLGGKKYPVTRMASDGSYSGTDGSYIPGATRTIQVLGSVQPATAEDLVSIPEGDRTRERFRFYSFQPLKNNDTEHLRKGDVVPYRGQNYQVESVKHWPNHSLAIIARVNTNAN